MYKTARHKIEKGFIDFNVWLFVKAISFDTNAPPFLFFLNNFHKNIVLFFKDLVFDIFFYCILENIFTKHIDRVIVA